MRLSANKKVEMYFVHIQNEKHDLHFIGKTNHVIHFVS